jgi:hypothetical protein
MAKRRRREGKQRKRLLSQERLAHAPQAVTAGVVSIGLAAQAFPAERCDLPCTNPYGGGAAVLPPDFDIDTVPTRIHYVPVINLPGATGGTATLR